MTARNLFIFKWFHTIIGNIFNIKTSLKEIIMIVPETHVPVKCGKSLKTLNCDVFEYTRYDFYRFLMYYFSVRYFATIHAIILLIIIPLICVNLKHKIVFETLIIYLDIFIDSCCPQLF